MKDGRVLTMSNLSAKHKCFTLCAFPELIESWQVGGEPGSVTVWHGSYEQYKEKLQDEFVSAGLVTNGTVKGVK